MQNHKVEEKIADAFQKAAIFMRGGQYLLAAELAEKATKVAKAANRVDEAYHSLGNAFDELDGFNVGNTPKEES